MRRKYQKRLLCAGLGMILLLSGCGMSSELAAVSEAGKEETDPGNGVELLQWSAVKGI